MRYLEHIDWAHLMRGISSFLHCLILLLVFHRYILQTKKSSRTTYIEIDIFHLQLPEVVISYLFTPCFCSLAKESVVNDTGEKKMSLTMYNLSLLNLFIQWRYFEKAQNKSS